MNSVVNRRVFVGTVAAGLPLLATGGAVTAAQRGPRAGRRRGDAVDIELHRQLRENVKGLRGRRPGESARALAATLRVFVADFTVTGFDAEVKAQLQAAIRREGEEAFLLKDIDADRFAAELKDFGLTQAPVLTRDYAARRQAVRYILANGVTPTIKALADFFDKASVDLDMLTVQPVTLRTPASCPDLTNQIRMLEILLGVTCLVNYVGCVVITGMLTGLYIMLWTYGC